MLRFAGTDRSASVALFGAVAAILVSCATGAAPDRESEADSRQSPPPPATDRWKEGALELPSRSPVVGVARLGALLENLRRLRAWIVEEPAMFGEEGDQFVRRFRSAWNRLSRAVGFDPLSAETPRRVGLDGDRPAYLGLYPASGAGVEFVEGIERAVRRSAQIDEGRPVGPELRAMRDGDRSIPPKLFSSVRDSVDSRPAAGLRLVLPIEDSSEFGDRFRAAARTLGYREIPDDEIARIGAASTGGEGTDPGMDGFFRESGPWPELLLRPGDDWLRIDVAFRSSPAVSRADERDPAARARSALELLLESSTSGRPSAPRAAERPLFSVSADQSGTGAFIRMQAYRRALRNASRTAVERRNEVLVESLARAATVGEDWNRASDVITGSSYSLYGTGSETTADPLIRLTSTLFGPSPSTTPNIDSVDVGLGVDDRGFGISLDFDPFFDSAWHEWLGVDGAAQLAESSEIADRHPVPYLLSLPRNLAFVVSSIDSVVRDALPESLAEAYAHRHHLQRIELATAGSNAGALGNDPQIVGLLTFDREADRQEIDAILEALPPLLRAAFEVADERSPGENSDESPDTSVSSGELESFDLPEGHPASPFYYFARADVGGAFIFFGHGIDRAAASAEVDAIVRGDREPVNDRALFVRLEPATAVASLSAFDTDALDPLQPGILAQRLGAFVLSVAPERSESIQRLRYQLELRRPPDL